jgi:diacylglycerol kinase (ATP)
VIGRRDVALGEDLGAGADTMQLETMQMRTRATSTVRSIRPPGSRPIQIVVTPGSGNGAAAAMAGSLREALRARGHEVRLDIFPRLQALQRWAETDPSRISHLVSVGGDGTQSAVAMAVARRSVPFLPVPAGFGNLFARAFRLGSCVEDVIDRLEHGEIVRADVGLQNGEPFLCHTGFGLVSGVQAHVEAGSYPRVRWRRWVEYYRTAVRHLREMPLAAMRVVVDGRVVTDDAVVVTVANVETYGPWFRLTPAASPVDGLFDVFVMHGATKREVLTKLLRRHLRVPRADSGTHVYQSRRVSVIASASPRQDLEVAPGVLPVLVSPDRRRAFDQTLAPAADASPVWYRQPA